MESFNTLLNSTPVQAKYTIAYDGDVEMFEVWYKGVEVTSILSEADYNDLKMECYKAYETDCEEAKGEAMIDRYESELSDKQSGRFDD